MADPAPKPQGNPGYLTEQDIRIWLRDTDPEANLLIRDYEFGHEEIRTAQTLAVDYFNEASPNLTIYNFEYTNFPFRYHLLMGTAANLLFIAANRYRRNELQYNIGGGAVADQSKAPAYDTAGEKLWEQYKVWCADKKRELNIRQGWARA